MMGWTSGAKLFGSVCVILWLVACGGQEGEDLTDTRSKDGNTSTPSDTDTDSDSDADSDTDSDTDSDADADPTSTGATAQTADTGE